MHELVFKNNNSRKQIVSELQNRLFTYLQTILLSFIVGNGIELSLMLVET